VSLIHSESRKLIIPRCVLHSDPDDRTSRNQERGEGEGKWNGKRRWRGRDAVNGRDEGRDERERERESAEDARVKLVSGAKAGCRPVFRTNPCIIPEQLHQAGTHEEPSIQTIHRLHRLHRAPHEASLNMCASSTFPDFTGAAVCEVNYRRIIAPYMSPVWLMRRG